MDGVHFVARWLDTANLASNAAKPVAHWQQENYIDIQASSAVCVYAEKGERLTNALQEVGYAIACGKSIYCIGSPADSAEEGASATFMHPDYEPWCRSNPEAIFRAKSFAQAQGMILARARNVPWVEAEPGLTPEQLLTAARNNRQTMPEGPNHDQ